MATLPGRRPPSCPVLAADLVVQQVAAVQRGMLGIGARAERPETRRKRQRSARAHPPRHRCHRTDRQQRAGDGTGCDRSARCGAGTGARPPASRAPRPAPPRRRLRRPAPPRLLLPVGEDARAFRARNRGPGSQRPEQHARPVEGEHHRPAAGGVGVATRPARLRLTRHRSQLWSRPLRRRPGLRRGQRAHAAYVGAEPSASEPRPRLDRGRLSARVAPADRDHRRRPRHRQARRGADPRRRHAPDRDRLGARRRRRAPS